jgi:cell division protein FtsZ
MIEFVNEPERLAVIKVVGVGGAGGNAVNRMVEAGLSGVEFHAVNTDLQALGASRAHNVQQIGARLTRGLGSGGDPDIGRRAAEEDEEGIGAALDGADMVFVTAGMGGGTGTGAAPLVAASARKQGALTVAIVTRPFLFEGRVRRRQAEDGIEALEDAVDTLLVIPNQRLLEVVPPETSILEAFRCADNVLYEATRGIHDIIARPSHINLDFADVRAVMRDAGAALMGTGRATGENRAREAAENALRSPLLEDVDIQGARGALVNILAADVSLAETSVVMEAVQDAVGDDAHVILGYGTDPELGDTLQVTVIATGFGRRRELGTGTADMVAAEHDAAPRTAPAATVAPNGWEAEAVAPTAPVHETTETPTTAPLETSDSKAPLAPSEPTLEAASEAGAMAAADRPPETGLLASEAAAGGDDRAVVDHPTLHHRFLRPMGLQPLTSISAPADAAPEPSRATRSRRVSNGFRSDDLVGDLNAPAYTRKYMD